MDMSAVLESVDFYFFVAAFVFLSCVPWLDKHIEQGVFKNVKIRR